MALRVVFFGTPVFAIPTLSAIFDSSHEVVAVVTQPDRPRGRGQRVSPSPVKAIAVERALPIFQPERLRDPVLLDAIRALAPDVGIVAAYGRLLPQALLDVPSRAMLNVHASLLPRWRGAAPVHRAILAGDETTGVTIMRVVLALDAGPMLAAIPTAIGPDDTSEDLEERLANLGSELMIATLDRMEADGDLPSTPQDERLVTYAARLERRDGEVNWSRPARDLHNQIRGLHPWPLAAVFLQGRRMLLHRSAVISDEPVTAPPGTIVRVGADALEVAAHPGVLGLRVVQLDGKRPVPVSDLLNGWRIEAGERFTGPV